MRTSAISAISAKGRQGRQDRYTLHKVTKITKSTDPMGHDCSGDPSTKQYRGVVGSNVLALLFSLAPFLFVLLYFSRGCAVFPSRAADCGHRSKEAMVVGRALLLLALLGASSAYSLTSASLSRPQQHRLPRRCASLSLPTLRTCTRRPDLHSHTQPRRASSYRCRTPTSVSCAQSAQSAHAGEARR